MPPFLQKLFRKAAPPVLEKPVVAAPVPAAAPATSPVRSHHESSMVVPQVAVARLSLLPILQKLPDDLRANVVSFPEGDITVALPITTIQKQLACGSVKMSLASLYRQAPHGTFSQARVEEKRMIDVPLAEVLRHVQPEAFRRRAGQRAIEVPHSTPALFGDRSNPFAMRPSEEEDFPVRDLEPKFSLDDLDPATEALQATVPLQMPAEPAPAIEGSVRLPLSNLYSAWPEPFRSEAASVPDTVLEIPASLLAASLSKGKAIFSWKQLRGWLQPPLQVDLSEEDETELTLPLKVVAPAFLAHTRPVSSRKAAFDLDAEIPQLFNGGPAPATASEEEPSIQLPPSPALAAEEVPVTEAAFRLEIAPSPTAPLAFKLAEEEQAPEPEVVAIIEPEPPVAPVAPPTERSPQQIVESVASLPGVAGAIVALQEGLVVAAKLPETMKDDTIAAFLPQIFARLNNYAQEMKIGEVEEVLLAANGAHFQGYRLGEVYFAVLGQPGQPLPWDAVRAAVQELLAQHPR